MFFLEIVPVEQKDAKQIVAMILQEFPYAKMNPEKFLKKIKRKGIRAFKAVEKNAIIGFLELEKTGYDSSQINSLIIALQFRNKGLGKSLLDFAVDFLKKRHIRRIHLLVKQSNAEAKNLYYDAGFRFMALLEHRIENEPVEELEMNIHEEGEESPSYIG